MGVQPERNKRITILIYAVVNEKGDSFAEEPVGGRMLE